MIAIHDPLDVYARPFGRERGALAIVDAGADQEAVVASHGARHRESVGGHRRLSSDESKPDCPVLLLRDDALEVTYVTSSGGTEIVRFGAVASVLWRSATVEQPPEPKKRATTAGVFKTYTLEFSACCSITVVAMNMRFVRGGQKAV